MSNDAAIVERLALLAEELGEAVQVIGKILRHGLDNYNPYDNTKTTNQELLQKELGDVYAAIVLLEKYGVVDRSRIKEYSKDKLRRVAKWLHHGRESTYER